MKPEFRLRRLGRDQAFTDDDLRVRGRLPVSEWPSCDSLQPLLPPAGRVYLVFVDYARRDFKLGTCFRCGFAAGPLGTTPWQQWQLLGVTQQYNQSWPEIPRGWKTICAFQYLAGPAADQLAQLPEASSWHEHPLSESLRLTALS